MARKVPRALLLYNPGAPGVRAGRERKLDSLTSTFRSRQILLDVVPTEGPGHALDLTDTVSEREYDLFIAWGGDGTVNEVGNLAARLERPLAILPGGTVNLLAGELGIPKRFEEAADLLFTGRRRRIKAGRAGERLFFVMAGVGFDAAVCRAVSPRLKNWLGRAAFLLSGARLLLTYPFPSVIVRCDSLAFTGMQVVISNLPPYAGRLKLAPMASLESPALDLNVLSSDGRFTCARFFVRLLLGNHTRWRELVHIKGWSFAAASPEPVPVHVDGEYCGTLPMTFDTVPDALEVLTPAAGPPSPLLERGEGS